MSPQWKLRSEVLRKGPAAPPPPPFVWLVVLLYSSVSILAPGLGIPHTVVGLWPSSPLRKPATAGAVPSLTVHHSHLLFCLPFHI